MLKAIEEVYGGPLFSEMIRESVNMEFPSVNMEFTIVHSLTRYRYYRCVEYLITEKGFNVDFYYEPFHRLTLLHVIAKFHLHPFLPEESEFVRRLILRSNNLLLKNNFGKTIIMLAKSMGNKNTEFMLEVICEAMGKKMRALAFVVDLALQR